MRECPNHRQVSMALHLASQATNTPGTHPRGSLHADNCASAPLFLERPETYFEPSPAVGGGCGSSHVSSPWSLPWCQALSPPTPACRYMTLQRLFVRLAFAPHRPTLPSSVQYMGTVIRHDSIMPSLRNLILLYRRKLSCFSIRHVESWIPPRYCQRIKART